MSHKFERKALFGSALLVNLGAARPSSYEFPPISSNLFNRAAPMPRASNFIVAQKRKANSYYQAIFECFPRVVNAGTKRDKVARSGEDDFAHSIR